MFFAFQVQISCASFKPRKLSVLDSAGLKDFSVSHVKLKDLIKEDFSPSIHAFIVSRDERLTFYTPRPPT